MCRQVPTADSALQSASALLRDAMRLALDDFTATLKQHAAVPSASSLLFGNAPSSVGGESGLPAGQVPLPLMGTPRTGNRYHFRALVFFELWFSSKVSS